MINDKQILLVDDNKDTLNQIAAIVKASGFKQVLLSHGGDNAWVIMKNKTIDCIIAAYEMKEMSGLSLLKISKGEQAFCDIPFFLTDHTFTKLKVLKAGQLGVAGLFVVPCDETIIKSRILKSLENIKDPVVVKAHEAFDHGLQLIEKKEYATALNVFTTLVKQQDNPEYYYNIGYIKTSQGKHGEAIEAFSKATQLDRLFAKAYEEMGRVYRLMGDFAKAEEYMQLAAEIYMDTDKIGEAEDVLNEILESGTESLNVFNTLGVLYRRKGNTKLALLQYKKALKVHPDEPYIYYNVGRLYLDMKNSSEAKKYFRQALEKDPQFKDAKQVLKAIDLGIV